jgi:hypothetical protein
LRESDAIEGVCGLAQREREKIRKPLSNTPFNLNWRGSHEGASFAESPKTLL